jgi:hypothetical protein
LKPHNRAELLWSTIVYDRKPLFPFKKTTAVIAIKNRPGGSAANGAGLFPVAIAPEATAAAAFADNIVSMLVLLRVVSAAAVRADCARRHPIIFATVHFL